MLKKSTGSSCCSLFKSGSELPFDGGRESIFSIQRESNNGTTRIHEHVRGGFSLRGQNALNHRGWREAVTDYRM